MDPRMNEHPEHLLAEYVDGTLRADDRARVEAHLADCSSCRDEVELAGEARDTLRSLPEVSPPAGLSFDVRRRAWSRATSGVAWKVAAGTAAAAVIIIGAVVALRGGVAGLGEAQGDAGEAAAPRLEGPPPEEGPTEPTQGDRSATLARPASGARYVQSDRGYDLSSLADLGRKLRSQAGLAIREGFPQPAESFDEASPASQLPEVARAAGRCTFRGLPPDGVAVPFHIEAARFEGEPAYIGAFLRSPAPQQPYDRLLLSVVSRNGCTLRYFATLRL
jgi:hypothetical protein